MARKITVSIRRKSYALMASSEQHERLIRLAADNVDRLIENYAGKFKAQDSDDILIFTALNVCMQNLNYKEEILKLQQEAEALEREFKGYLDKID